MNDQERAAGTSDLQHQPRPNPPLPPGPSPGLRAGSSALLPNTTRGTLLPSAWAGDRRAWLARYLTLKRAAKPLYPAA